MQDQTKTSKFIMGKVGQLEGRSTLRIQKNTQTCKEETAQQQKNGLTTQLQEGSNVTNSSLQEMLASIT